MCKFVVLAFALTFNLKRPAGLFGARGVVVRHWLAPVLLLSSLGGQSCGVGYGSGFLVFGLPQQQERDYRGRE
jgi:hypothetical protein